MLIYLFIIYDFLLFLSSLYFFYPILLYTFSLTYPFVYIKRAMQLIYNKANYFSCQRGIKAGDPCIPPPPVRVLHVAPEHLSQAAPALTDLSCWGWKTPLARSLTADPTTPYGLHATVVLVACYVTNIVGVAELLLPYLLA